MCPQIFSLKGGTYQTINLNHHSLLWEHFHEMYIMHVTYIYISSAPHPWENKCSQTTYSIFIIRFVEAVDVLCSVQACKAGLFAIDTPKCGFKVRILTTGISNTILRSPLPMLLGNLGSTTRQGRRRGLQNVKKAMEI